MRLSFQIAAVVVLTYVVGTFVAAWSLPNAKAPSIDELRATGAALNVIFSQSSHDLRACGLTGSGADPVSHGELVIVARCLERKRLITSKQRQAVERDKNLHLTGSSGQLAGHAVEYAWAWQETIVWLAGALLIGFLLYRRRRHGGRKGQ